MPHNLLKVSRANRIINNPFGFTFIELVLVLGVVSLLTLIILPLGNRWFKEKIEKDNLNSFVSCVYNMQTYSMAHNVSSKLVFKNNGTTYAASIASGFEIICSGSFQQDMRLSNHSNMRVVEFLPNGNILKSGVMAFNLNTQILEIRFQLVRGRIIIYE